MVWYVCVSPMPQPPRRSLCGWHPCSPASPMPIVGVKPVMVACARSRNAWVKVHVFWWGLGGFYPTWPFQRFSPSGIGIDFSWDFHGPSWVCQGATCLLKLVRHDELHPQIHGRCSMWSWWCCRLLAWRVGCMEYLRCLLGMKFITFSDELDLWNRKMDFHGDFLGFKLPMGKPLKWSA